MPYPLFGAFSGVHRRAQYLPAGMPQTRSSPSIRFRLCHGDARLSPRIMPAAVNAAFLTRTSHEWLIPSLINGRCFSLLSGFSAPPLRRRAGLFHHQFMVSVNTMCRLSDFIPAAGGPKHPGFFRNAGSFHYRKPAEGTR
ncbi:hypothetical protein HMPREF3039_02823 [Akkermansia sp. KLE1798]|nr:hypothetical protein HMPREF3039_02823 [Akkermansia sp. KLE1798]